MLEIERTFFCGIVIAAALAVATVVAMPNKDSTVERLEVSTAIPSQQMSTALKKTF